MMAAPRGAGVRETHTLKSRWPPQPWPSSASTRARGWRCSTRPGRMRRRGWLECWRLRRAWRRRRRALRRCSRTTWASNATWLPCWRPWEPRPTPPPRTRSSSGGRAPGRRARTRSGRRLRRRQGCVWRLPPPSPSSANPRSPSSAPPPTTATARGAPRFPPGDCAGRRRRLRRMVARRSRLPSLTTSARPLASSPTETCLSCPTPTRLATAAWPPPWRAWRGQAVMAMQMRAMASPPRLPLRSSACASKSLTPTRARAACSSMPASPPSPLGVAAPARCPWGRRGMKPQTQRGGGARRAEATPPPALPRRLLPTPLSASTRSPPGPPPPPCRVSASCSPPGSPSRPPWPPRWPTARRASVCARPSYSPAPPAPAEPPPPAPPPPPWASKSCTTRAPTWRPRRAAAAARRPRSRPPQTRPTPTLPRCCCCRIWMCCSHPALLCLMPLPRGGRPPPWRRLLQPACACRRLSPLDWASPTFSPRTAPACRWMVGASSTLWPR